MTPERWREVDRIYHAALARQAGERAAFVLEACASDEALLKEVHSLLAQEGATAFLETPAVAAAGAALASSSPSLVGRSLGPYQITAVLGAGGMGEVYRARDTTLGRDVAIKVLPAIFTSDPERLARFEREARILASLNHPHIGAIYGLEAREGIRALVLELVEGATLADTLGQVRRVGRDGQVGHASAVASGLSRTSTGLSIVEALSIARQIAEALEAAHEKGIIHRDLKPSNVVITPASVVKVLDFGLAKAAGGDAPGPDLTHSPTLTVGGTRDGMLLGTAAYMSPEQARGQVVDKRTDIWAFGCVLYEMLTGRVAFPGATITDTLAAIIEREPDWRALPATTPPGIRRLLERCLEKDLKRRLRDIGDVQADIDDALSPRHGQTASNASTRDRRRVPLSWVLAAALVVAVGAAVAVWRLLSTSSAPAPERLSFAIPPPPGVTWGYLPVDPSAQASPDGRSVAFASTSPEGRRIWVHSIDTGVARALPGTQDATAFGDVFWSPDSHALAYCGDGGKLKKVEVAGPGRDERTVGCGRGAGLGSWSASGDILLADFNGIFLVPAAGEVRHVTTPSPQAFHRYPKWLPDGRHFVFLISNVRAATQPGQTPPLAGGIYLGSVDGAAPKQLVPDGASGADVATMPVYVAWRKGMGALLFVRGATLVAQRFNEDALALEGETVSLAERIGIGYLVRTGNYSASPKLLVFRSGSAFAPTRSTWVDRAGRPLEDINRELEVLNRELAAIAGVRISPTDERTIVYAKYDYDTNNFSLWLNDFRRGVPQLLRKTTYSESVPVWSPDARRLAYLSAETGPLSPRILTLGGDSRPLAVPTVQALARFGGASDWSPDGKWIVGGGDQSLRAVPADGVGDSIVLAKGRVNQARFSPDGHWLAYNSDESGASEVYVQAFPAGTHKTRVSTDGGPAPEWGGNGTELFYVTPRGGFMSVRLRSGPTFQPERPTLLFTTPGNLGGDGGGGLSYAVSKDGQRFLLTLRVGDPPPLTAVLNWMSVLDRKPGASR